MNPFLYRRNLLFTGVSLCLVLTLSSAVAGLDSRSQWDGKLDQLERQLAIGDWQRGQSAAERVLRKMIKRYAAFESSPRSMARAVALLAVAEAGSRNRELAAWYWAVAHTLDSQSTRMDLGPYGEAGKYLSEVPLRLAGQIPRIYGEAYHDLRPKEIETPIPEICSHLEFARENPPTPLEIEVVVDAEGKVRSPRLAWPSRFPGFALVVLEGARSWRFEPATVDGEPVTSLATVNIRFPRDRW